MSIADVCAVRAADLHVLTITDLVDRLVLVGQIATTSPTSAGYRHGEAGDWLIRPPLSVY
jgi:hypothetical protein